MINENEMRKMKNFLRMIPLEVFIDEDEDIDLEPVRIEKHGRTTVVFWADGTATAVRRQAEDEDNEYAAFCAAVTKRVYGSNSQIKSIIRDLTVEQSPKRKAKSEAAKATDACPIDKPCAEQKAERNSGDRELTLEEKSYLNWEQSDLNDKARAQYEAHKQDMWTCPKCGKTYPWQTGQKGRFAFCFKCNTAGQETAQQ